ncbi:hypothetical protein GKZ90_0021135 [Flavobacterium sp. MC2016-06]|uniref:hypothetical protein n=1 Tax=Flavobacterium sp. MC2016-06 TaxID=2676308 RepID=UPI0012BB0FF6|nr:hypothetical protein [Flavobacterium sp. MC2016-06]MBU3861006.1 hypothetical protein [Flavobacterium sp. MC2016-06]
MKNPLDEQLEIIRKEIKTQFAEIEKESKLELISIYILLCGVLICCIFFIV